MDGSLPLFQADQVVCLIPAYQPSEELPRLVDTIRRLGVTRIVVIDDGSGQGAKPVFDRLSGVEVVRNAINLGKGAALKHGLNYAYCRFPEAQTFVTADADGQHAAADVVRVSLEGLAHPDDLILGVRSFRSGVPLRNRFGNELTRKMVHIFLGSSLADTQTGLRAIPRSLVPVLLRIPATGYEFELDMLVAAKHTRVPLREVAIQTIYLDGNRSSHFNPVLDSMKIYFVLMRFSAVAILTAILDNAVFLLAYSASASILSSQVSGRLVAMLFNYIAARKAVFQTGGPHGGTVGKYVLLVAANATISYALIHLLMRYAETHVLWSKLAAESLLFLANFALQRDFVFTGPRHSTVASATDWDRYYQATPATAHLTRRYTAGVLDGILHRFPQAAPHQIIEIGGANSCFADRILRRFQPAEYRVLDTNEFGLSLLRKRYPQPSPVVTECADVLAIPSPQVAAGQSGADVVFSIGLIEHFTPEQTRRAIQSHFHLVREGGIVILSFPTPTLLYRIARRLCEAAGVWKFPDERPLAPEEVLDAVAGHGEVLFRKTLWPLVFTQHMIALRARTERPLGSTSSVTVSAEA